MINLNVDNFGDGKRLIPFLQNKFNNLSLGTIHKALRNKDIRVNDIKVKENVLLNEGDILTIYIKDELLYGSKLSKIDVIYEDDNIVVVNKPQGVLVQSDDVEIGIDKAVYEHCNSKDVSPCHRLDRNTSGLVIFAKNELSKDAMLRMIKERVVRKFYHARVYGVPMEKSATLTAYLFKDAKKSNVIISDVPKKGYQKIITRYALIEKYNDGTSLLEVELITGRTHQIRAHLAHIDLPIIGDGKYGINKINKEFKLNKQALKSCKLIFDDAYYPLEYLKEKIIKL